MRAFLKSCTRFLRVGWFWAFVLLALPNCGLPNIQLEDDGGCGQESCDGDGDGPTQPVLVFDPGDTPSDGIFCDFPKPVEPGGSECAVGDEWVGGLTYAGAAVALVEGQSSGTAFDWSPTSTGACAGLPKKVEFIEGSFPQGYTLCINCGTQVGGVNKYATNLKACIAQCTDLLNTGGGFIPAEGAASFCEDHVTLSTNSEKDMCYPGACTSGGNPAMPYDDPRTHQENVTWIDASVGVEVFGTDNNSLKRNAATSGPADTDFNEGAASAQLITTGDGWVEFQAGQNDVSHVISLRASCDDLDTCPEVDHGLGDIGFGISLNNDNSFYVIEAGSPLMVAGPFGTYAPGDRFRIRVTDQYIIQAQVHYYKQDCTSTPCTWTRFYESTTTPTYPLRVDATFREQDATLENVTMVRIKK